MNDDVSRLSQLYSKGFYAHIAEGSAASAWEVLPFVFSLCDPKAVCDVGCGTGSWLSVAKKLGAARIFGIDGPHVQESSLEIELGEFRSQNLEQNTEVGGRFDLAMSLEVAEHLSEQRATDYVASLTSAAPVILFSAAVPGQGGTNHVNEQWPSWWMLKFEKNGFSVLDCIRPRFWENPRVEWWYAQNMLLIVANSELPKFENLRWSMRTSDTPMLNIVHPRRLVPYPASSRR